MASLFYFTDFTTPSLTALENILSLADTLRARIIFLHFLPGKADEPVSQKEEELRIPDLNACRQCVMHYAYAQNCRMLTGHLFLRAGDLDGLRSAIYRHTPYAAIYMHGNAGIAFRELRSVFFETGTCILCSTPAIRFPVRIKSVYVGSLQHLHSAVMDGMSHFLGMLRGKLEIIYPAHEKEQEAQFIARYNDAFRFDHVHLHSIQHFGLQVLHRENEQTSLVCVHAADQSILQAENEMDTWPLTYGFPFLIFPEQYTFRAISVEEA